MNTTSPILLIGVGTSGCAIARGVNRAFGTGLRYVLADTDSSAGTDGEPFVLLGGDRLSGRGTGGDIVSGRSAAEDSAAAIDETLAGIRLAVIATCLGGGTGGGATIEIAKRLSRRGIPSVIFATTPFAFEGEKRQHNACSVMSMIEDAANAVFFLPLDKFVQGEDNMANALRRAIDTVATGVTLFWRLVEKPGYIRLDTERLRHILDSAGRGRFAAVSVQGQNRDTDAVDMLVRSEMLSSESSPVRTIICGILGGEDLRLSEVSRISDGLRTAFGKTSTFDLGTVNDEDTFTGRLSVVVMLFERNGKDETEPAHGSGKRSRQTRTQNPLGIGPTGRGRFNNAEPTIYEGNDLDVPTFIRRNVSLDY